MWPFKDLNSKYNNLYHISVNYAAVDRKLIGNNSKVLKSVSYFKFNFINQLNLNAITFSANVFPNEGIHAPSRLVNDEYMPYTWLNGLILEEVWCFYVLNDWLFWGYTCGRCCVANSSLQKREGNWGELTFAKTYGTVNKVKEKNWPMLTGASLVKIPETIMGFPDPFSFNFWSDELHTF